MTKKILITLSLLVFLAPGIASADEVKMATVYNPSTGHRESVVVGDPYAFQGGYILETKEPMIGFAPSTGYSERLSESITAIATEIPVSSVDDSDGTTLTCSATNKCYFNIEQGTSKEERVVCSGLSTTAFTPCVRGLAATGNSEVGDSDLTFPHNAGSRIIMTNIAQFYSNYVNLYDDQTKSAGVLTFTESPIVPAPTTDSQATTKAYVDGVAQQGGATSTATVVGIVQLGTQAEMAAGTFDSDEPQVLSTQYASSTPLIATTIIPITGTDGKLSQSFLDLTEDFAFATTTQATSTIEYAEIANLYVTGSTTVPTPTGDDDIANKAYVDSFGNKKLLTGTTVVDTHSSTNEQTVFTTTLSGGELGSNNAVEIEIPFSELDMNTTGTFDIKIKYGGTTLATISQAGSSGAVDMTGSITAFIIATSTDAQKGIIELKATENGSDPNGALNVAHSFATGFATEDSTGDLTLAVTVKNSESNSSYGIVTEGYIASIIK